MIISLANYLKGNKGSKQTQIAIFQQICDGMEYLHSQGIVHGRLSLSNIMVYIANEKEKPHYFLRLLIIIQ